VDTSDTETRRIAKVLAERGVASRREAERLVTEGRVRVNGERIAHPGHPVDPLADVIKVDNRTIGAPSRKVYVLLYKPKGYITGRNDPEGRRSVLELLPDLGERIEPVGRLDFNTEGALLLTNDGELAHRLTHPSTSVPKRYFVKCWKTPDERTLERLMRGVDLEDGRTLPCKARVVDTTDNGNGWVEVTVTEGRNRLVRRAFAALGHPVSKLRRESFATVSIRGLERGECRPLTTEEVDRLRDLCAGVAPAEAGKAARRSKAGFAKPNPEWLAKRLDRQKRKVKSTTSPRDGAAR
jgi:23S rRNA pseudouridine2605 synthase